MYELLDDADPNLESKMIRIPHYKWILPNNVLFLSLLFVVFQFGYVLIL